MSSFLLGGFWYSKSFSADFGIEKPGEVKRPNTVNRSSSARVFGVSIVLSVIAAVASRNLDRPKSAA